MAVAIEFPGKVGLREPTRTVVSVIGKDRSEIGALKPDTYDRARKAAPGWDVRVLEQEWRAWAEEVLKSADAAFIGFCKKRFAEKGRP